MQRSVKYVLQGIPRHTTSGLKWNGYLLQGCLWYYLVSHYMMATASASVDPDCVPVRVHPGTGSGGPLAAVERASRIRESRPRSRDAACRPPRGCPPRTPRGGLYAPFSLAFSSAPRPLTFPRAHWNALRPPFRHLHARLTGPSFELQIARAIVNIICFQMIQYTGMIMRCSDHFRRRP